MMDNPSSFPTPFQHIRMPNLNNAPIASAPTSTTEFSITSTMDTRLFREDGGRWFQACNDDYALPADDEEEIRLNVQHRGWKATNGGKNYVAPMAEVLVNQGEGKRIMDIGTGTGIWAVEMAREFPLAEVIGFDLVPYPSNINLPPNLQLLLADCAKGLDYPDGHFDIVHGRMIIGGIRDWKALMDEIVRVTKPGGLIVLAESAAPWPLIDPAPEGVGKGCTDLLELVGRAAVVRGLDMVAGPITIPRMMATHPGIREVGHKYVNCPLHPWSTDPARREAGAIMIEDAKLMPETFRLLCVDACGLSTAQYDRIKAAFLRDLYDERVHSALPIWHTWGWRV